MNPMKIVWGRVRTEPSEAGRQRGRRAWGDAGHVAEHGRGAGAKVDQVVLCGLVQHLQVETHANCGFMTVEQWRSLWLMRKSRYLSRGEKGTGGK